jgi:hypothetical protein
MDKALSRVHVLDFIDHLTGLQRGYEDFSIWSDEAVWIRLRCLQKSKSFRHCAFNFGLGAGCALFGVDRCRYHDTGSHRETKPIRWRQVSAFRSGLKRRSGLIQYNSGIYGDNVIAIGKNGIKVEFLYLMRILHKSGDFEQHVFYLRNIRSRLASIAC